MSKRPPVLDTISSARNAYKSYDWDDAVKVIRTTIDKSQEILRDIDILAREIGLVLPVITPREEPTGISIELDTPELAHRGVPIIPVIRILFEKARIRKPYADFILYVVTPLDMDDALTSWNDIITNSWSRDNSDLPNLEKDLSRNLQEYYKVSLDKVLEFIEDLSYG